jgi:hypothetical protein
MLPTVVLKAKVDLDEWAPFGTFWFSHQVHAGFLGRLVGLLRVAPDAGANDVLFGCQVVHPNKLFIHRVKTDFAALRIGWNQKWANLIIKVPERTVVADKSDCPGCLARTASRYSGSYRAKRVEFFGTACHTVVI